jgi:hypothetical protein
MTPLIVHTTTSEANLSFRQDSMSQIWRGHQYLLPRVEHRALSSLEVRERRFA